MHEFDTEAPARCAGRRSPSPPPPVGSTGRRRQKAKKALRRILVVEDEAVVAMELAGLLEEAGYKVVATVGSAEGAVAECRRRAPDLLVMDITLHDGGDGIAAAEQIRREMGIRCIFVSAVSDRATVDRAKAVGLGYIAKPYNARHLLRAVGAVFET
jgi:DNA-binding NarL/FixJ family response regulator